MSELATPQRIAIAVVENDGRYLVRERPAGTPLAGFSEFAGGKVHANELPQDAAIRECLEETGLTVRVTETLAEVDHAYDHGALRLFFYGCVPNDPARPPSGGFRWVDALMLASLKFPPANASVLEGILRRHEAAIWPPTPGP